MEDKSLLVEGTWWKNKKTGETGFITDVQKKKGLIIFRFFPSGHVGSFTNMEFLRKFEISPSNPKPAIKNIGVTVGSIWRGVKGMEECNKGRLIKVVHINGSLISWKFLANAAGCPAIKPNDINTTCEGSFLYCFEKVQGNDDGAIYRPFDRTHDSEENPDKYQMAKVVETNVLTTSGGFVYGEIKYVVIPVSADVYSMNLEDFHSEFELFSLNPAKEFCVDSNDPNYSRKLTDPTHTKKSDDSDECDKPQTHVITPGSIYFNCVGGIHIAIPFKEESGVVSFITSDVLNDEVYFRTDVIEFIERYTLYQVFNKPDNGEAFDELVNKTKERYDKMIRKDELIMENSKETYLKTDTSKLKDFGTGAKREDKTGKGRYDLIPGDVMSELEDFAWETYFNNGSTTCSATDVSKSAYFDDWANVELYYDFIVNVISYFFAKDHIECTDDYGEISYEVNWDIFRSGLYEMRKQLALHYEAGAVVHGVDNWKKGLPVYGSERGGCFLDSMRRHIDQALMGLTDEPHAVAALWNAFCAVWTLKNKPENITTKPEKDVKTSKYSDMIDSLIHAASRYAEVKSKDCETECLTLPSGRKIKIEFLHARTNDEKDEAFLRALLRDNNTIDDIMNSLKRINNAGDDQN